MAQAVGAALPNQALQPYLSQRAQRLTHSQQRLLRERLVVRMARTESTESALGSTAPNFKLPEPLTKKDVSLDDVAAKGSSEALLVLFICNHCPFVIAIMEQLQKVAKDYASRGLSSVAISSNSVQTHAQDGPEMMAKFAVEYGLTFPYLYDESQEVARAYGAACTPDIYLYDSRRRLQYHGQFDSSRPGNGKPVTGQDLMAAIDLVLQGKAVPDQKPSIGCSIKWHP